MGDATPEAAAARMANNGGLLVIVDDEGTILHHALGMYSAQPNLGLILKGWDGAEYDRDRVGDGDQGDQHIPRVLIGMGLAIQPGVEDRMRATPARVERGALPRFLISHPDPVAGTRMLSGDGEQQGDEEALAPLHERVKALWQATRDNHEPVELRFSPEASRRFTEWHDEQERLMLDLGSQERLYVPKRRSSVARLAAVFHLLLTRGPEVVTEIRCRRGGAGDRPGAVLRRPRVRRGGPRHPPRRLEGAHLLEGSRGHAGRPAARVDGAGDHPRRATSAAPREGRPGPSPRLRVPVRARVGAPHRPEGRVRERGPGRRQALARVRGEPRPVDPADCTPAPP